MMDHKFIGLDVDDMIFGKDDRDQSAVNRGALLYPHVLTVWFFLYLFGTSQPTCGCVEPLLRSLYDKTYSAKAPKHANGQPAAAGCPFPVQARPAACGGHILPSADRSCRGGRLRCPAQSALIVPDLILDFFQVGLERLDLLLYPRLLAYKQVMALLESCVSFHAPVNVLFDVPNGDAGVFQTVNHGNISEIFLFKQPLASGAALSTKGRSPSFVVIAQGRNGASGACGRLADGIGFHDEQSSLQTMLKNNLKKV